MKRLGNKVGLAPFARRAQDAAALGELDARAFAEAKPGKVTLVPDRAKLQPDFAAADIAQSWRDLRHALMLCFRLLSSGW